MEQESPRIVHCADCRTSKSVRRRLPSGWKRTGADYFCGTCWNKRYVLRSITIPVAAPADISWLDLRALLKNLYKEVTSASNWMVTQMFTQDVRRSPTHEKMPQMPEIRSSSGKKGLYTDAREQFPSLPPQSVSSLEQAILRKYRSKRYNVVWTCSESLPVYRYPQPVPFHNQSWTPMIVEDRPQVCLRLMSGDRVNIRLRGGYRFARQMQAFTMMCSGQAQRGELSLYERGDTLMCKMIAWLPRKAGETMSGTLHVHSAADALLIAANQKGETVWRWNADHVRRWRAQHRKQLQRWSDDQKAEQRPVPDFQPRREASSERFHARMTTAADQAAAYVANYAKRRRFAAVDYNDSEKSYMEDFVWFRMRERLQVLLDEYGIEFRVSSQPREENEGPLAVDR